MGGKQKLYVGARHLFSPYVGTKNALWWRGLCSGIVSTCRDRSSWVVRSNPAKVYEGGYLKQDVFVVKNRSKSLCNVGRTCTEKILNVLSDVLHLANPTTSEFTTTTPAFKWAR
jgi:hypothetical protein